MPGPDDQVGIPDEETQDNEIPGLSEEDEEFDVPTEADGDLEDDTVDVFVIEKDNTLTDIMESYLNSIKNYKQLVARSITIRQNRNYSGVAGPIYSDSRETTVSVQTGYGNDDEGY